MIRRVLVGVSFLLLLPLFASATTCLDLSRTLSQGSTGSDVSRLQEFLRTNAGYAGAISGNMGPLTIAALTRWQVYKGIIPTAYSPGAGTTGPKTRAAMACGSTPLTTSTRAPSASPTPAASPTVASLLAQLNTLKQRLAELQGSPSPVSASVTFSRTLDIGARGTDVTALQTLLKSSGFLSAEATGYFGTQTRAAVIAYQRANALDAVGTVGPKTRALLNVQTGTTSRPPPAGGGGGGGGNPHPRTFASCSLDSTTLSSGQSQTFYSNRSVQSPLQCSSVAQIRTCLDGVLSGIGTYATCTEVTVPERASCTVGSTTIKDGETGTFYSSDSAITPTLCSSISQTRTCTDGTLSGSATFNIASCEQKTTLPTIQASCMLDGETLQSGSSQTFYTSKAVSFGTLCSSVAQSRTCADGALSGSASFAFATCSVAAPSSCTQNGVSVSHGASQTFYSSQTLPYGQQCSAISQSRSCSNGTLSGQSTYQYATCVVSAPPLLAPTVTFTQTLATTTSDGTTGESFTVGWSATGATACTVQKSFPDGTIANPWGSGVSGSQVASPFKLGIHKWWIDCTGNGGTTHKEFIHDVVTSQATDITENFNSREGFSLKVSGDPALIDYAIENGMLKLTHRPHDRVNFGGVEKSYEVDLSKTVWFDFRFRMQEQLLGQDLYTTLKFNGREDLSLTIEINSEQHWKHVYLDGKGEPACTAKPSDDEYIIGASPALFQSSETRVRYPTGYTKPYTEWTTYSIKYEPPPAAGGQGVFTFYVDGREVPGVKIDEPGKILETRTSGLAGMKRVPVTVSFGLLMDGREHGYPGNRYGVRGRGCYADATPARPVPVTYPAKFANNDGSAFKTDWMKKFDAIAVLLMDATKGVGLPCSEYQTPRSSHGLFEAINACGIPTGTFGVYDKYQRRLAQSASQPVSGSVRTDLENRIWNGIYEGTIDFDAAVLMGTIPLPNADHLIWGYTPAGARAKLQASLDRQAQFYAHLAPPERYVWDMLHDKGGTVEAAHLGYVTPVALRASDIWQVLSPQEKADIQAPSTPVPGVFYWDYFRISYSPPQVVANNSQTNTNLASALTALEGVMKTLLGIFGR
ncbi:hypothetical protein A2763_01725 [Candidatus Kaiserbacteria bacterium RIFCSPHIGHO2_01_FULL_54_36]|uniref:Peptidoglycan binding-like domain-containing protein n=1 Tax=Candidatus Kaiserbacteria bacterium RIFCSPHIGHO2_01_FULL_54_36 TaxID=1798482 RepID=A0A1F6CMM1_9BACT|nr:MAG: hypothetical protein A2763_01725 [Candidatus Kaiserbacteria bacterium RIFCSPHIGHO2_01_FULL_54_36]OGG75838.1 MAG: hypothetical protein A3A41_02760 [Candidatus Kaiserbacteria bacterium RIFCSPLOWO2_01_FULL_54_22]